LFGVDIELNIQMIAYMTFNTTDVNDFDFRHGNARTSSIKKIEYIETSRFCYDIIITTANSVYTFQHGTHHQVKSHSQKKKD